MLEIQNVSKQFGRLRVLDRVSMIALPGRVTAVLGPNAAGKTTLAKIILGLTKADSGVIRLDGVPSRFDEAYKARIGYMPQEARFPENLNTRELLEMLRDLRGEGTERDDDLLHEFGLTEHLTKPFRTLSGGTRQKVNAAVAFLFDPCVLVLDEPTGGLDPAASGILKDKIRAEKGRGKTFVLTSHIMSELEELADDVVFLNNGRVQFTGEVMDLKDETGERKLEKAIAEMMRRGRAA